MKYLILEKGSGQGCEYTIACNQRWKIVESDLPYEQFRMQCVKYAVFGGDYNADPLDYCLRDMNDGYGISELHIIELPTLLTTDMKQAYDYFNDIIRSKNLEKDQKDKREMFEKLKRELEEK